MESFPRTQSNGHPFAERITQATSVLPLQSDPLGRNYTSRLFPARNLMDPLTPLDKQHRFAQFELYRNASAAA